MSYSCKILLDSISPTGKRLTTFEITFPRIVLAEAKTHRVLRGWGQNVELEYLELDLFNLGMNDDESLSRNSASTRAIPLEKQIQRILDDPFIPEKFPINCKGMQPQEGITKESDEHEYSKHRQRWLEKLNLAIDEARYDASEYNWHKQLIGRSLEIFMWHTAIISATEFSNFFKLRCDENAQYEIRRIANLMYEAYHAFDKSISEPIDIITGGKIEWQAIRPQKLKLGEWHCPLVYEEDELAIQKYVDDILNENIETPKWFHYTPTKFIREPVYLDVKKAISVARCARVSYLTHDGKRDIDKDLELFERLRTSGHWSPFEHVATPYFDKIGGGLQGLFPINHKSGNFIGWKQYRKEFADENCTSFRKEQQ